MESAFKTKLDHFPRLTIKDNKQLFKLADILAEIEAAKENPKFATLLSYLDSSSGILPIINKLPYNLQEKWTTQASNYKKRYDISYPPFSFLLQFPQDMSRVRNDPGFQYKGQFKLKGKQSTTIPLSGSGSRDRLSVRTNKTEFVTKPSKVISQMCVIHSTSQSPHSLKDCRTLRSEKVAERKKILKDVAVIQSIWLETAKQI